MSEQGRDRLLTRVESVPGSSPSVLSRTRRLAGHDTPPLAATGSNRVPVLTRHPDTRKDDKGRLRDGSIGMMAYSNASTSEGYTVPFGVPSYIDQLNQLAPRFHTTASTIEPGKHKYWLPTFWDTHDKSSLLDLTSDSLQASFGGSAKYGDRDAAAIRSNRSIPPQCAVYYFEVTVIDKGQAGYIGIGVSGPNVSLSRLPGWEKESWALHGDDGSIFSGRGQGTPFGPTYGTGDTIGVGIDWTHAHVLHATPASNSTARPTEAHGPLAKIFFTKNGQMLGQSNSSYAFENVACTALYPTVGLRTPGEKVKANFGAEPFLFDITGYTRQRRLATLLEFKSLGSIHDSVLHKLMLSYLTHYGYAQTAAAFAKTAKMPVQDPSAIERRGRIRRAILDGHLSEARQDLESVASPESGSASLDSPLPLVRMREWIELYWRSLEARSAYSSATSNPLKGKGKAVDSSLPTTTPAEATAAAEDDDDMYALDPSEESLLLLGAELNASYASTHARELETTFSLLAYQVLDSMPPDVRRLLSQEARDELADKVNTYLLQSEGNPARPALEMAWRYAEAQRQWASELGTRAALVSIDDAFSNTH